VSPLALLAVPALAIAYLIAGRPRVLEWGARPDEVARRLPGDDVIEGVGIQTTRAITIDASPDYVWPWLMQMGPRPRGGVYTSDWIENLFGLDIHSVDVILPQYQSLVPGRLSRAQPEDGPACHRGARSRGVGTAVGTGRLHVDLRALARRREDTASFTQPHPRLRYCLPHHHALHGGRLAGHGARHVSRHQVASGEAATGP
jgi:hypothetical protein